MDTWTIRDRATGDVVSVMPIPEHPHERQRALDGMVRKIDFEKFMLIDSGTERLDAGGES